MEEKMITWKTALALSTKFLLYSLIIILVDFVLIAVLTGEITNITSTLSLVMLMEGGIGLIMGGAGAMYSPSAVKISEVLFHSKPWNLNRQKEIEKQMRAVIITALILVIEALLVSAI
jgi:hypothetical protein